MFKILRGMVFNLQEPSISQTIPTTCMTKLRPYVVLSNNGCNDTSMYIHVAPLTSRPNTKNKYYRVEFTMANGEKRWINISDIMLIRAELCTADNFNANLTCDIQNDETLNDRLAYAIQRQFSIAPAPATETVVETVRPTPTEFNLPISITVSIPGYESVSMGLTPKADKAEVQTEVVKEQAVVENPAEVEVPATPTVHNPRFYRFYKPKYIEAIKKRCRAFGGDLPQVELAKILGVSPWTVQKYVQYIKAVASGETAVIQQPTGRESATLKKLKFIREHYTKFGGDMTVDELCEALGLKKTTLYVYVSEAAKLPKTDDGKITIIGGYDVDMPLSDNYSDTTTTSYTTPEIATKTNDSAKNKKDSRRDEIIETVSRRFRKFGGDLTIVQLAKLLSVSTGTIDRYIKLCKQFNLTTEDMYAQDRYTKPERVKYADMTKAVREQFIKDFETLPLDTVFEKYKMYGIQSIEHMTKVYKAKKKFYSYSNYSE